MIGNKYGPSMLATIDGRGPIKMMVDTGPVRGQSFFSWKGLGGDEEKVGGV